MHDKYIIFIPNYPEGFGPDAKEIIKKIDNSWTKHKNPFTKDKYIRVEKQFEAYADGFEFSVNIFIFTTLNLFIYMIELISSNGSIEHKVLRGNEFFMEVVCKDLLIDSIIEPIIPYYIEVFNENNDTFEQSKTNLIKNCYFHEKTRANEIYVGEDTKTQITTLLILLDLHDKLMQVILRNIIVISSLREYSLKIAQILSRDHDKDYRLKIYNFIYNYTLYTNKSLVNGIFNKYLNYSLKPFENLMDDYKHNTSKDIREILNHIHRSDKIILFLTIIIVFNIIIETLKYIPPLSEWLSTIF